jgi:hypothetical protein
MLARRRAALQGHRHKDRSEVLEPRRTQTSCWPHLLLDIQTFDGLPPGATTGLGVAQQLHLGLATRVSLVIIDA